MFKTYIKPLTDLKPLSTIHTSFNTTINTFFRVIPCTSVAIRSWTQNVVGQASYNITSATMFAHFENCGTAKIS